MATEVKASMEELAPLVVGRSIEGREGLVKQVGKRLVNSVWVGL